MILSISMLPCASLFKGGDLHEHLAFDKCDSYFFIEHAINQIEHILRKSHMRIEYKHQIQRRNKMLTNIFVDW
jgi:hypothetical protein